MTAGTVHKHRSELILHARIKRQVMVSCIKG